MNIMACLTELTFMTLWMITSMQIARKNSKFPLQQKLLLRTYP